MLKFYSTGQDFREIKAPQRFLPQRGAADTSSSFPKRNFIENDKIDFKSSANVKHPKEAYKQSFELRNHGLDSNKKYYESQYKSIESSKNKRLSESQPIIINKNQVDTTAERNQFLAKDTTHYHNWEVQKKRQFAFQQRQQDKSVPQSQIIDKKEYIQKFKQGGTQSSFKSKNSQSSTFLPRENFYRTKPLLRLDNDFKDKPLIKNVQTISEDTPQWQQSTNRYYDPKIIDVTKKSKKQKIEKGDLFGNPIVKHENNFMFGYDVPYPGLRSETNKMVICDKDELKFKKKHSITDARRGHIKIDWKEDDKKQKYNYQMPQKIFSNPEKPYIKKLEFKRTVKDEQQFQKVGSQTEFRLLNKDKDVQLKIGHGQPQTINPVKYQPNEIGKGSRYY